MQKIITSICKTCDKPYSIPFHRKDKARYCSRKCFFISRTGTKRPLISERMKGSNNPAWKGGKTRNERGYIYIWQPDHPFCRKQGYVRQSRIIAEKYLGRFLDPSEVVHHINSIRDDDRPENLFVFSNHSEHMRFHQCLRYGNSFLKTWLKSNIFKIQLFL